MPRRSHNWRLHRRLAARAVGVKKNSRRVSQLFLRKAGRLTLGRRSTRGAPRGVSSFLLSWILIVMLFLLNWRHASRLLVILVSLACLQLHQVSRGEDSVEPTATPVIVHTEYLPYPEEHSEAMPFQLCRELVRQAFIKTIRDDFRLPVVDQTLGESLADDEAAIHLAVVERANFPEKTWHIKLVVLEPGVDTSNLWDRDNVWEKKFQWRHNARMFPKASSVLNASSQAEFKEALTMAGLQPAPAAEGSAPEVSLGIEDSLRDVNFVSQFAAVRQAHQAIAAAGKTDPWVEVLVRGYANLSLLTHHQWNAASEAFAARSFLYAQELIDAPEVSERALWHHAYAYAIGGVHNQGLDDIKEIKKLQRQRAKPERDSPGEQAETPPSIDPEWGELLDRLCRCNREGLTEFGQQHPEWNPWAVRLRFFLTSTYGYHDWMFDEMDDVRQACPFAYGVYAKLVSPMSPLGVKRTGAAEALVAFRRGTSETLSELSELPPGIRAVIDQSDAVEDQGIFPGRRFSTSDLFPKKPSLAAAALRATSTADSANGLSWSVLAYLLEEELYVEIAHFLYISTDATETSLDEIVDQAIPLLQDHRYLGFIKSFKYSRRLQWDSFAACFADMEIVDPSCLMSPIRYMAYKVPYAGGATVSYVIYSGSNRNFTVYGMVEKVFHHTPLSRDWIRTEGHPYYPMVANEMRQISRHLELANRMQIGITSKLTEKRLQQWESKIRDDPDSWFQLALRYEEFGQPEEARKALEKSLELKRTRYATKQLANYYKQEGDREKWRSLYLEYIEKTESLGLSHASVHALIAQDYIEYGQWELAQPHADFAARTYSASGLALAAKVAEALAQWEKSESLIRACSEHYPSGSGDYWFLWCVRTGRGDRQAARELAERMILSSGPEKSRDQWVKIGAFHLINQNPREALHAYRQAFKLTRSPTCAFMTAQLARKLELAGVGEETLRQLGAELDEREANLEAAGTEASGEDASGKEKAKAAKATWEGSRVRDLAVISAARLIANYIAEGEISEKNEKELETRLAELTEVTRSAFCYFVAVELAEHDQHAEAEKFWRRSLVLPQRDWLYATLSGQRLARIYGASRPDNKPLTEEDIWPARGEWGQR